MRALTSRRLVSTALLLLCCSGAFLFLQYTNKTFLLDEKHSRADDEFRARLLGPVRYDDPKLLDLIKTQHMYPPSTLPYNLLSDHEYENYKNMGFYMEAMKVVLHYLHNKTNGIFVEAGALDGQYLSNTLELEKNQDWTGLLVEASYINYKSILLKNRKAWVSHSCLAVHPYPHTMSTKVEFDTPPIDPFN
ncbi:uncharacterized protein LOC108679036 [Hyalella azteca]|uniref:Uncharacterized protein LOC108679036 n=1 Tax=Hyalella azteca TaxID=294128 RepID=A0A8B7PAD2_HYAAZ|nr:uncharacterized protein LOC108679036 [Hyalella azteca]